MVRIPASHRVAELIGTLAGCTAIRLFNKFPFQRKNSGLITSDRAINLLVQLEPMKKIILYTQDQNKQSKEDEERQRLLERK